MTDDIRLLWSDGFWTLLSLYLCVCGVMFPLTLVVLWWEARKHERN